MRTVRLSKTFNDQLVELIDRGSERFGRRVAEEKQLLVLDTIERLLVHNPRIKPPDPRIGMVVYPVTKTPFLVVYDFDDDVLRVHFVFHAGASLENLDPHSAEW